MAHNSRIESLEEYKAYLSKVKANNPNIQKAYSKLTDVFGNDDDIDSVIRDKSLSPREFVEIIALCRLSNYVRSTGGANKAAENETDRLYAKNPWKFVEEFLQNADDCNYVQTPEIAIAIDDRNENHCCIEFSYNEEGFSRNDVWAITAFSESTKVNDTVKKQIESGIFYKEKTGRKGKGFKSVFSLRAENVIVHIRSNGFSFKLDNRIGRIMPVWEDDPGRMDGKTHVIVELVRPGFDVGEIYPEFRRLFCVDHAEEIFAGSPFLFMHRLKMVSATRIGKSGEESFITEYHENREKTVYAEPFELNAGKTVLAGIAEQGIYYREQFQEGEINTISGDDGETHIPVVRYTRMVEDDEAYRNYSIIAPVLKTDTEVQWQAGALFRTFPMSLHPIGMPIAVDAPFILNPDRSGVQYSSYKDENGTMIPASSWNSEVAERLFEKNGVYEAFFMRLRSVEDIRIDRYVSAKPTVLFEDRNNSDGHGNTWIPCFDLGALTHSYPLFRLFADPSRFVCYDEARIVNRELFHWPCADRLFEFVLGSDYENHIVSDIYIGSGLFRAKPIIEDGFPDAINKYLDVVEADLGLESREMVSFFNKQLYPFLRDNANLIEQKDGNAFKKMRIFVCRVKFGKSICTVREERSDKGFWYHSNHGERILSVNRYRVYESSPMDVEIIENIIDLGMMKITLQMNFSETNQGKAAKNIKSWAEAKDYIEAAHHFGYSTDRLLIPCLKKFALGVGLDPEFNAFRETGTCGTIPDEDVSVLAECFETDIPEMAARLKRMGVRSGNDVFTQERGTYLLLDELTLAVLRSGNCPPEFLQVILSEKAKYKKNIDITYADIKDCREDIMLFFLNESNGLFSVDSYADLCGHVQNREDYWNRKDYDASELLIRAIAGASDDLEGKDTRTLTISLEEVLRRGLAECVISIAQKKKLGGLIIENQEFFEPIPEEEIMPRLALLGRNTSETGRYYKGNIGAFGSNSLYLKDINGGHTYLQCDGSGDYRAALEACVNRRFDDESFQYLYEVERNYRDVREQIIVPLFNRTGHDLSRTYDEAERRFREYDKKQIINILSWFRTQGYTNAFGNGNISNEREIEDDYKNAPWKFVNEFIQNVDDCLFENRKPELRVLLDWESITFEYNEAGFTLSDVMAITKFGDSNKQGNLETIQTEDGLFDREKTGRKGRGFKSVFALPGKGIIVHICSNGFSFKFVKRLGTIIPIWEDVADAPAAGTRITIEGFEKSYINTLAADIKHMFAADDLSSFCTSCPMIYLRKLEKISVTGAGEAFSIDIAPVNRSFSEKTFQGSGDILAGIMHDGSLCSSMWERYHVTVFSSGRTNQFAAVKYSEMYSDGHEVRVCSVFAPLLTGRPDVWFRGGSLYRTLPLDGHVIPVPLSINAPFDTNSGRSALEDRADRNELLVQFVFGSLLKGFFDHLKTVPGIRMDAYIPGKPGILFSGYKNIKQIDLQAIIKGLPVLKAYGQDKYVSCQEAKVLPAECYDWIAPEVLSDCFDPGGNTLIERRYAALGLAKYRIQMCSDQFVESINQYLDSIDVDVYSQKKLMMQYIYPFLDRYYEDIIRRYREHDRQDELKKLKIFLFEMADGTTVREYADPGKRWIAGVPEQYRSFGKYRAMTRSSLENGPAGRRWVKELHTILDYKAAFTENSLGVKAADSWEKTAEIISTMLYYGIEPRAKIPYLENCALSETLDQSENLFREGFLATGDNAILRHVIEQEELIRIGEAAGLPCESIVRKTIETIYAMGLKSADDFFEDMGKGMYSLNHATLALLKSFCKDRSTAARVLDVVKNAHHAARKQNGISLIIQYNDLQQCDAPVFSGLFELEIVNSDSQTKLAEAYIKFHEFGNGADDAEAYLRALDLVQTMPETRSVSIRLSEVTERKLGYVVQSCKVTYQDNLDLTIIVDEEVSDYPSEEITKAIMWLNDSNTDRVSYEFYTTDLSQAFENSNLPGAHFIFDNTRVFLDAADAENCMLKFVQKRYRGKDTGFSDLVNIITEQNELKKPWKKSKKEYVEKLAKFRRDTHEKRKVLFPDYDEHLIQANGEATKYVIPELLQNINDCAAAPGQDSRTLDVSVNPVSGTMLLTYDEAGFDYANVYSITAIGQSSKHDESEGEKGLGFKKIFSVFDTVEIYSNGFCFSLSAQRNTVPIWVADKNRQSRYLIPGKTVMLFTTGASGKKKLVDLYEQWESLVNGEYVGNKVSPLFLRNIDTIRLEGCEKQYSRKEMEKEFVFTTVPLLSFYEVLLIESGEENVRGCLARAREELQERRKCRVMNPDELEHYLASLSVEMCLPVRVSDQNRGKGCFYSTLPTEQLLNSTIFLNVPLELTTGRDGIIEESSYNKAVFRLLFAPAGRGISVFEKLLEKTASGNRNLFMLNYLMPDFRKLSECIAELTGESAETVRGRFVGLHFFEAYGSNRLASIDESFRESEMAKTARSSSPRLK